MGRSFRDPRGLVYVGIIIFLCLSAVFFLFADRLFFQAREYPLYERESEKSSDVLGIRSVVWYDGFERVGGMYDREKLAEAISEIREPMERALDTATAPEEAGESDWRVALASQSVYMDLCGQVPAEIFWDAFGVTECPLEADITGAALYINEKAVRVIFRCAESSYYILTTELEQSAIFPASFEDFASLRLVAELGSPYTDVLEPETIVSEEAVQALRRIQGISLDPDGFDNLSRLLTAFSVNPYTDSAYTEEDGTRIYKNSFGTLSITEKGAVAFRADEGAGLTVEQKEGKTELQNGLLAVNTLLQNAVGTESLSSYYLESVTKEETITLNFRLRVGAIPVTEGGKPYTAVAVISEGKIVSLEFSFCGLVEDERITVTELDTGAKQLRYFAENRTKKGTPPGLVYYMQSEIAIPSWVG